MPGRVKYQHTYLPYTDGIDPKLLRVGTLVLDIYNPTEGKETDRFEFREGLSQDDYEAYIKDLPGYSVRQDLDRSLSFSASREWGMSAGLIDLAHGGVNSQGEIHVTLDGGRFRRIEMQKPVKFLEDIVAKQDGFDKFVRDKTTAEWYTRWYRKMDGSADSIKTPKLWLCTGVQLISNARVKTGASTGAGQEVSARIDPGMFQGVPTGQAVVEVEGHHNHEEQVDSEYNQLDERVWAAKFFSLRIKLTHPEETVGGAEHEEDHKKKVLRVVLGEVEDLGAGGVREDVPEMNAKVDDNGRRVAELEGLDRPDGPEVDENEQEEAANFEINGEAYADATAEIDWETFKEYNTYIGTMDD